MNYAKKLYAMLALLYMLPYLQGVSMGVTSTTLGKELGLSAHDLGLMGAAYQYGYAAVQIMAGILAARFGSRLTFAIFLSLAAIGSCIFSFAHSLPTIMLGRALCGMGMAVGLTSSLTLFVRWFAPHDYGRLCGWFFCIGGMGGVLGTAPLALLNQSFGWRSIFFVLACITAVAAVACILFVRDKPPHAHTGAPNAAQTVDAPRMTLRTLAQGLGQVARRYDFWRLCSWFFCVSGIYYGFFALWGGPYLSTVHKLSQAQVGGILSMGALGFVVGSPVCTWFCEHILHSYRWGLTVSAVLAALCTCLLTGINDTLSVPALYAVALMLGIAANAPNAIAYAAARDLFGPSLAGSIAGILGFCSFAGGGILQSLSGFLLDAALARGMTENTAFATALFPYLPFALLCAVLCSGLTETCPPKSTPGRR